jgi:hypothetical protein
MPLNGNLHESVPLLRFRSRVYVTIGDIDDTFIGRVVASSVATHRLSQR